MLLFLQTKEQSIGLKKTGLLQNNMKLFGKIVQNYLLPKEEVTMPGNKLSPNENTLNLPPRFISTSSSGDESESEFSSFKKQQKHHKGNQVPIKKRNVKSLNAEV